MNSFLHPLASVFPSYLCLSRSSPHPRSLSHRAQGPSAPQDGYKTGEERKFVAWLPRVLPGKPGPARTQAPASPLSLPPAPGHRGPVALVSEVFEQHLGGHILQVRPLPYPLLLAATWWPPAGNCTLFSGIHPTWSSRTGRRMLGMPASSQGHGSPVFPSIKNPY